MVSVDRIQGLSGGLAIKTPCLVATTVAITLSGLQTIDGVLLAAGDRVLVKDQSDATTNGIYDASTGTWSRALDFDGANDVENGTLVLVSSGTANAGLMFKTSATNPVTPSTTAVTFTVSAVFDNISAFGASLLDDANATAARSTLGLVIGADVQAYDADIPTVSASQGEMEAGTEAALRSMSPLRVAQAIAALVPVVASTPTGSVFDYVGTAAPTGYVLLSGRTIGNGASGGTERANADTSALFTLLWDSMADAEAPVSTGRGANAAADFAANKTITLPDARGRIIAGKDNMGGSTASRITNAGAGIVGTTLGAVGGTETHTLTTAQLAAHTHSEVTAVNNASQWSTGDYGPAATSGSGSTGSAGSGNAHQNTQPTLVLNKIIKL